CAHLRRHSRHLVLPSLLVPPLLRFCFFRFARQFFGLPFGDEGFTEQLCQPPIKLRFALFRLALGVVWDSQPVATRQRVGRFRHFHLQRQFHDRTKFGFGFCLGL